MADKVFPHFTGDPWLDGIIWGCGSKSTRKTIMLNVSNLPYPLIEIIKLMFTKKGFKTKILEVPNAITKEVDLRIEVESIDNIFEYLIRFNERNIFPTYHHEFLNGYIISKIEPVADRTQRGAPDSFSVSNIIIKVRCGNTVNSVIKILKIRNIHFNRYGESSTLEIDPESYYIVPVSTFIVNLKEEFNTLKEGELDGEVILEQLEKEIRERRLKKTKPHLFDEQILSNIKMDLILQPRFASYLKDNYGDDYSELIEKLKKIGEPVRKHIINNHSIYSITTKNLMCKECGCAFPVSEQSSVVDNAYCYSCIENYSSQIDDTYTLRDTNNQEHIHSVISKHNEALTEESHFIDAHEQRETDDLHTMIQSNEIDSIHGMGGESQLNTTQNHQSINEIDKLESQSTSSDRPTLSISHQSRSSRSIKNWNQNESKKSSIIYKIKNEFNIPNESDEFNNESDLKNTNGVIDMIKHIFFKIDGEVKKYYRFHEESKERLIGQIYIKKNYFQTKPKRIKISLEIIE